VTASVARSMTRTALLLLSATNSLDSALSRASPAGELNCASVPVASVWPADALPARVLTFLVATTTCLMQLFPPSAT
jgi:hypothetical protein